MKHLVLSPLTAFAGVAVIVLSLGACSSTNEAPATPPPTAPPCDPTKCATRNECIADSAGVTACRLPCAAHTDCPFNYQCGVNAAEGGRNYCVKNTTEIVQKPTGQWGTHCLAPGGEKGNPACDAENGFVCLGAGTTDATAYCTRLECTTDLDCAGGFYCGTVNTAPNVKTDTRTWGTTRTACLRHEYCAPCNADLDCPVIDGKQTRCADDDSGTAKYCATPCETTANCRLDSACTRRLGDGSLVCRPRAGTCKGDGALCSPCRSDADCPQGFCLRGQYSPETFCTVKASSACEPAVSNKAKCPAFTGFAGTQVGCQTEADDPSIPKDQCFGVVPFDDNADVGCFTRH